MNKASQLNLDKTGLTFTTGWFRNRNQDTFIKYVYPRFSGKPTLYLELGVFEGMSLSWMLQHVLTHPDSRAVGVDPWLMMPKRDTDNMDSVRNRAISNLAKWGSKCQLFRSTSAEFLDACASYRKKLGGIRLDSLDLCMIDGNHWAPFVLYDAQRVYKLMKPGGLILFDDVENDRSKQNHVREGIQMWLKELGEGKVRQEFKHNYMEGYVKL